MKVTEPHIAVLGMTRVSPTTAVIYHNNREDACYGTKIHLVATEEEIDVIQRFCAAVAKAREPDDSDD